MEASQFFAPLKARKEKVTQRQGSFAELMAANFSTPYGVLRRRFCADRGFFSGELASMAMQTFEPQGATTWKTAYHIPKIFPLN